jgi:spoIIIJ-associated protein
METTTVPAQPPATTPRDPQEVLQQILTGLGIEAKIEASTTPAGLRFLITTAEPGRLIGRRGQTLSQLQFLVNRILFRHDPKAPRVIIDCEGYRDRQNDELIHKCNEAANRVRRWGDPVQIGPFGPAERRAVHEHFATDVEIEAVSDAGDDTGKKTMTLRIRQTPLTAPGQSRH